MSHIRHLQTRLFPDEPCNLAFYHHVLQSLMSTNGCILDIGCGDNSDLARYRTEDRTVWGTDFQTHPQLHDPGWFRIIAEDGRLPFEDNSCDLIACRWVLEHVRSPDVFFAEVHRKLRPGGTFVGLSVNGLHYVALCSRLAGLFPHGLTQFAVRVLYNRATHDTFPTYYRLNTEKHLRRSAERAGLQLGQLHRIANPDYFRFWWPLHNMASVTDWLLEKIRPGMGRLYFVAVIQKPAGSAETTISDAA